MPRPRKKYPFLTRLKFLISGEIQILQPRRSRAKAEAERKVIDKVSEQYNKLTPIK